MINQKPRKERRQQKKTYEVNGKRLASVVGTSLVAIPLATLMPEQVQANEFEQQITTSEQAFIDSISYSASSIANYNDLYASVMIAQALLESNYGNSALASAPNYNLFGIKGSYNGASVFMPTEEYLNGEWVTMTEPFRSYSSYDESLQDHANVLKTTLSSSGENYYAGAWKSNTASYADATATLTGRYATDPNYGEKLNVLISTYGLTAYDTETASSAEITSIATEQINGNVSTPTSQAYTVASGDTLWEIAEYYHLTVDQLMAMNGLSAEMIVVGQTLVVS